MNGQRDGKDGAFLLLALNTDGSPVADHGCIGDGKAEADAGTLGAEKGVKYANNIFFRDPCSRILDPDHKKFASRSVSMVITPPSGMRPWR